MIIRRDPRALNARKHGLTEAIHDGPLVKIVVAMAIRMVSLSLEKIDATNARAECQILFASRGYVRAEDTTRGVGLDEA